MSRRIVLAIAVLLLLSTLLAAQRPDRVQAVLLHKSQEAFVHAVPLQPGYLVTFTVPSTGVMKPLLKAEPQSPADDKAVASSGHGTLIRRTRQPQGELIAGVAVDDERLYVLTATRVFQNSALKGADGRTRGRADTSTRLAEEPPEIKLIGHQFTLHVFSLKDGAALMGEGYQLPLVSEDPKSTAPPDTTKVKETLGKGPIELIDGGLKCRGTTVIFSGNDVKSLEVKGKQFTPPPGFFGRDPSQGTR